MKFSPRLGRNVLDDRHEWLYIKRAAGKMPDKDNAELVSLEIELMHEIRKREGKDDLSSNELVRIASESIRMTIAALRAI